MFARQYIDDIIEHKDDLSVGMCQGNATTPVKRLRKKLLNGRVDPHRIRHRFDDGLSMHKAQGTASIGSGQNGLSFLANDFSQTVMDTGRGE